MYGNIFLPIYFVYLKQTLLPRRLHISMAHQLTNFYADPDSAIIFAIFQGYFQNSNKMIEKA